MVNKLVGIMPKPSQYLDELFMIYFFEMIKYTYILDY